MYHGNGGYDWHTVYNMPIWLRRFTIQSINEFNEKQVEEAKKSNKGTELKGIPKGPAIKRPTYSTKARK